MEWAILLKHQNKASVLYLFYNLLCYWVRFPNVHVYKLLTLTFLFFSSFFVPLSQYVQGIFVERYGIYFTPPCVFFKLFLFFRFF